MKKIKSLKKKRNNNLIFLCLTLIVFFAVIFASESKIIGNTNHSPLQDDKKIDSFVLSPAKATIKIGETANFKLIAKYEDGSEEIVKTEKFKGEKIGVFLVTSEYAGNKTQVLAKVRVVWNKKVYSVYFRPKKATIEIGDTEIFNLIAKYKDSSEGIVKVEEFKGKKTGTFEISGSFDQKQATASVIVKEKSVEIDQIEDDSANLVCPLGNLGKCVWCHVLKN